MRTRGITTLPITSCLVTKQGTRQCHNRWDRKKLQAASDQMSALSYRPPATGFSIQMNMETHLETFSKFSKSTFVSLYLHKVTWNSTSCKLRASNLIPCLLKCNSSSVQKAFHTERKLESWKWRLVWARSICHHLCRTRHTSKKSQPCWLNNPESSCNHFKNISVLIC